MQTQTTITIEADRPTYVLIVTSRGSVAPPLLVSVHTDREEAENELHAYVDRQNWDARTLGASRPADQYDRVQKYFSTTPERYTIRKQGR